MEVKFLVDGMLGTLARKLRIYGFDTLYYADLIDRQLINIAGREGRILLTSDRELFRLALSKRVNSILLIEGGDEQRLVSIFKRLGWKTLEMNPEASRCPVCNASLYQATREELSALLPSGILDSYDQFYRCSTCGKTYWEGSHWKRLRESAHSVRLKLHQG